jgi:hypothetical protein
MKKNPLLAAALCAVALLAPAGMFAADKPADKSDPSLAKLGPKARIFAQFDTNKNGIIDGDDVAAVRAAYAADPKGQFAVYDKDHDGKLSAEEIAAIKPPGAGGKTGAGKKTGATPETKKPDAK